jgi:nucleotide-binding universal stress UspA family protein
MTFEHKQSPMAPLKIVLLTDFSPLSKMAMQYALKMASKLEAEFTILNAVRVDGVPKSNLRWKQIEKSLMSVAEEEGAKLLQELKTKTSSPIGFKAVRAHTVSDMIKRYAAKNYTNLVVMGSRGASQLKKVRFGGTTVSVIDSLYSPVLAIPELAQYKEFKHVTYATDLKDIKKELELIIPFAKIFGSFLHVVHVVPVMDKKVEASKLNAESIIKNTGYTSIDFKLLIDDDVPQAIDQYIKEKKADLLATFTHELSLYEKLFGLSVTRKLAYQGNIPLLAFKRK